MKWRWLLLPVGSVVVFCSLIQLPRSEKFVFLRGAKQISVLTKDAGDRAVAELRTYEVNVPYPNFLDVVKKELSGKTRWSEIDQPGSIGKRPSGCHWATFSLQSELPFDVALTNARPAANVAGYELLTGVTRITIVQVRRRPTSVRGLLAHWLPAIFN